MRITLIKLISSTVSARSELSCCCLERETIGMVGASFVRHGENLTFWGHRSGLSGAPSVLSQILSTLSGHLCESFWFPRFT